MDIVTIICLLLVASGAITSAFPEHDLEAWCIQNPTKHVVRHPVYCSSYVECFNGVPMRRSCGAGLHYNEIKGVCDYPKFAGCEEGYPDERALHGPPLPHPSPSIYSPRPSLRPPRRKFGPPRRNDISHRTSFEETVYGSLSRGSPLGNQFRSYGNVMMQNAKEFVRERIKGEIFLFKKMHDVVDSGPFRMVSKFLNAQPYAKILSQAGMTSLHMMKLMRKRFGSEADISSMMRSSGMARSLRTLPDVYKPDTPMPIPPDIDYCPYPRHIDCDGKPLRFRTSDGSCNNLNNPLWGRSMTPFGRMVPHRYEDGIEEFRRSVTGRPLPGARLVSFRLFPDADISQRANNMALAAWGQLVDHDLTLTAITEVATDESMDETEELKCGYDGCQTDGPGLEACAPIPVPRDDSDFPYNRCLKFVRSLEVPLLSCETGPREQLNQATHWMDSSMVYGDNLEESDKLRDLSDRSRGRMATSPHPENPRDLKEVLPKEDNLECRDVNTTHPCNFAGDRRVNENTGLTVFHTTLIREHNRVEEALHHINPHWDGERLYLESRRIVGAVMQHVTFNEWLPLIVGSRALRDLDLELQPSGFYRGYNSAHDPRTANAFAAAAFRFGHTLLQERVRRVDEDYNVDDSLFLSETLFRPVHSYDLANGGLDALARGLVNQPCQSADQFFTNQVTRHLFTERPPFGPSMDLVSLNIQRGRDHGIGTYNDFRELCGLGRATTFSDLSEVVKDERALNGLRRIYDHVDDIDLFAGGVSERAVPDGQVGPTFACVIGRTFRELRRGDRFWYENDNEAGFTPDQLQEIRKSTLARVMCANLDSVKEVQRWLLMLPTKDHDDSAPFDPAFTLFSTVMGSRKLANPRLPCDSLPDPDLTLWKERGGY